MTACFGVVGQRRHVFGQHVGVILKLLVGERKAQVRAHVLHGFHVRLFLLVRRVSSGKGWTQTVALDGADDDDRGLAFVGRGLCISGVQFDKIVTAEVSAERFKIVVAPSFDQRGQHIGVEQFLSDGGAVGGEDALLITINQRFKASGQCTRGVLGKQPVPRRAPEDLDDVPACAAVPPFKLLYDLRIPTNGAVQPLEVAVHRHDDVVEAFTTRQGELRQRFGFVGLAVAHGVPHTRGGGADQTTVLEVAIKPGLMNRRHGAKPHANGGELPEIRHQARVRVRGEPLSTGFSSEGLNLVERKPSLHPSTGVDAGRSVALPVEMITGAVAFFSAEKMVETQFPGVGGGGVGGDVPTDALEVFVGSRHHHHGVPPYDTVKSLFERQIAGVGTLVVGVNGVHVRRVDDVHINAGVVGGCHGFQH